MTTRRALVALGLAAPIALAAPRAALAQRRPATADDIVLGKADAPLTLIEYASLACPFCARFHNEIFPAFKAKYIDTGQVKLVYREMLFHNPVFATAAELLARHAGESRYYDVVSAVFHQQTELDGSPQYRQKMLAIAQGVGMSEAEFDAAMNDAAMADAIKARAARYLNQDRINSTPTFRIGRRTSVGVPTMVQLDGFISAARSDR